MGIGPKKAQQLIDLGFSPKNNEVEIDKIAQELRKAKWQNYLGNETKLFLAANPKTPITRAEIKIVENEIKKLNVYAQIVGSYRRKKPISNDIDILVRVDDRNTLNRFVEMLPGKKYICSRGPDKIAIIYSPKRKSATYKQAAYKIDVFGASPDEFIPMLLYSTGSKEFNIEMRRRAKSLGYLLNQRGIFERATGKKISGLKTELAYFKFLKMPFLEPEAR
jgi:DNA polymerase/3'-5' exonuclease PolX